MLKRRRHKTTRKHASHRLAQHECWLFLGLMAVLFLAPLPLGANRPWAWSLLSVLCYLLAGAMLLAQQHNRQFMRRGGRPWFAYALLLFAIIPLLQIIPLPMELLNVISPGSYAAWSGLPGTQPDFATLTIDLHDTLDVGLRQGASVALVLAMMPLLRSSWARKRLAYGLIAIGAVNAVYGLIVFFDASHALAFNALIGREQAGVSGTYINKNHFAGLMQMTLPFAIVMTIQAWRSGHGLASVSAEDEPHSALFPLWLALSLLLAVALVMSGSRGGVAAFAVALLIVSLVAGSGDSLRKKLVRGIAGVLVLGVLAGFAIGWDAVWDLYSSKRFNDLRVVQWRDTVAALPGYWLLGSGTGTYEWFFAPEKSPQLGVLRFDHAHNDYLEFWSTMGLLGLVAFLIAAVTALRAGRRAVSGTDGFNADPLTFAACWALLSVMLHGLVDFNLQIPGNMLLFFVLMGFVITSRRPSHRPTYS